MIWVVGKCIYALNYIQQSNEKYINLITTDKNDYVCWSNRINKVYYIKYDSEYCKKIEELVGNDLVIATGEETMVLDEYIIKTGSNMNLFGHNPHRITYHNKENFMKLIEDMNLPYLKTWSPNDMINTSGTYILKAINSRGGIGQKIINVSDKYIVPENHILQPYISDKLDYSTFVIASNGEINKYVAYKCNEMMNGFSIERVVVDIKELHDMTLAIVKKLNYSGFLGLDFVNANDMYYCVDFNPRLTNGLLLLNNKKSINTIPYLIKGVRGRFIDAFKYSDMITLSDLMPFIIALLLFIGCIFMALITCTNPEDYIKKKMQEKMVKYE